MNSIAGSTSPLLFDNEKELYNLEKLIEEQGQILEMIAAGKDLHEILNAIVLWVEKESKEGVMASILLMDEKGERLLHGAAPSLPQLYNDAINGVVIGDGVGSCGTAAFIKKPVIVDDIATDPLWINFKDLALSHNLRSCWSSPLINKRGKVLGTFAMYYSYPKKPSNHDLQVIRLINSTTMLAIEWKHTEVEKKRLRESERIAYEKIMAERQRFHHLLMDAPALVAVLRGPGHVFELANAMYMQVVGETREIVGKPIREALPELHGQGLYELLDNVYNTGESFYGNEVPVKIETGKDEHKLVYFNFVYQPIHDEQGKVDGIFVHAVDVSELVQTLRFLQQRAVFVWR